MPPVAPGPRLPPLLTGSTPVLASQIPLPPTTSISYVKFLSAADRQQQQHKTVELARQHIVNSVRQSSTGVLDSLLPVVRIGKEDAVLWVFAIGSGSDNHTYREELRGKGRTVPNAVVELEAFTFDGLHKCQYSQFTWSTLYACCSKCKGSQVRCSCAHTTDSSAQTRARESFSDSILPGASLRPLYALFLDAVRDRLIDDICTTSMYPVGPKPLTDQQIPRPLLTATRLGTGFLSVIHDSPPRWSAGWDHSSRKSTLIHTALHISLCESSIYIRPLPTQTSLLPLPVYHSIPTLRQSVNSTQSLCTLHPPLTRGAPLILAPYQIPAHYVSTHTNPSIPNSLIAQFSDALAGLGAYCFRIHSQTSCHQSTSSFLTSKSPIPLQSSLDLSREPFVLVVVPLANPQGEPKGLTALWPAHLVFIDTSTKRSHLMDLPEMPGTEILLTPPRGPGQLTGQPSLSAVTPSRIQRQFPTFRSPDRVSRTQRTFRVLELLSHKRVPGVPIPSTAKQAAGYVENVAREREKERERANQERARRERDIKEGKSTPGLSTATTITVTTNVTPVSQTSSGPSVPGASVSKTPTGSTCTVGANSMLSTFFSKAVQRNEANSFYPSPPDWDPIATISGSGVPEHPSSVANTSEMSTSSTDINLCSNIQSQSGSNVASQTITNGLNDIALSMDMELTMNMNIGIDLGETMGFDVNVDMDAAGLIDGTFGSFTDDDFNYFDSVPATVPISTPHLQSPFQGLHAGESAVDGWLSNGLQQTDANVSNQLRHHTSTGITQGRTPTYVGADAVTSSTNGMHISEDDEEVLPSAPDLVPSSPAKSPWSPGNPPTPSLELGTLTSVSGKGMFEPITFGKSHCLADGKYRDSSGKFAFAQFSPQSSSSTSVPGTPSSPSSDKDDGWKFRYDAVTDPRIGVVKRLRGVKRKLSQTMQYGKVPKGCERDEEWASVYDNKDQTDTLSSSSESEAELGQPEHEEDCDDNASYTSHPSRPSTPPPAGLPLMTALLYTHFHHAHLLPLGTPMRTSYDDLASHTGPLPAPISVPTPVSPAAGLGSVSERNKTLELLAQAVVKEVVENDVWAEAWAISSDVPPEEKSVILDRGVSQVELKYIFDLLEKVDGLSGSIPLSTLVESRSPSSSPVTQPTSIHDNKLQLMHPPWISIGRAGLVHHMLPPAIRFWEKEGLGPRGGTKDVVAFSLFEEGDERADLVEKWMNRVSRVYNARGFGSHVAGSAGIFERGLVPLQFEAIRKTLPNLLSALPSEPPHIVIYVIAPSSTAFSLNSPTLRTIITSQKRIPKFPGQHAFDQGRVLIHFVPEYLISDPHTYPTTRYVGLERFVTSVYDRLLRLTLRQTSRQLWEYSQPLEHRFQVPAYVLARKTPLQTHLEWEERPSLNVLDRHMFLQVGYRISACGNWLLAACIDERGEAHDLAVWSVPDSASMNTNWVVSNVWIFVKQFAQRADTEWRIVVAKLGEMEESEVEVWMSHLETVASAYSEPPVHVSLVCAQNDIPLSFLSAPDTTSKTPERISKESGGIFTDVSSITYSAFFTHRIPVISPDSFCPLHYPSHLAPTAPEDDAEQPMSKGSFGILPLSTTALLRVPNEGGLTAVSTLYIHLLHEYKSAKSTIKHTTPEVHMDITRNWYELSVLTRERWHFAQQLPFHLAALQVMSEVLNPLASGQDSIIKEAAFLGG